MQFVYLDTDDELRRMMEGDFAAWRTYLHPTQRAVAHRETYNGPFRLAGGAGTGKTVVALHRAAFLAAGPAPGSCSAPSPATSRRTWRSTCAPC